VAPAAASGRAVYERECLACHMADGRGVPGMAPALLQSPWVSGDADALIGFVLTGGFGPEVLMAPFDYLPDEQMAALLTYLRQAFAAGGSPVSEGQVARVRAATGQSVSGRQGP
jgi:mono/diheme cytochrome c family protein